MINELIKAISRRLKECIPEVTNRYSHNPTQNFEEPCFIIECINQANQDLLTLEYEPEITLVDYMFSVTLLLPRNNTLLKDIAFRVLLCLKWLYLDNGKPVITLNRQAHPIDDSSYSFTFTVQREAINKGEKPPLMEKMNETVGLNDEEE